MGRIIRKSLDNPEETRLFVDKGKLDLVNIETGPVGRAIFEPGWRWSLHVKPIAKTESCDAGHMTYCVSGRMRIRLDDGEEAEVGPADFAVIPPGHDAWTVGNEPCVMVDWQGLADYAKGVSHISCRPRTPQSSLRRVPGSELMPDPPRFGEN